MKLDSSSSLSFSMTPLSLSSNSSSSSNEILISQPSDKLEAKYLIFENEYLNRYSSNMKAISIINTREIFKKVSINENFDILIFGDQESISTDISIKSQEGLILNLETQFNEIEKNITWIMKFSLLKDCKISNSLIRVYRNQGKIQILKYEYENLKLSDSKNKESQIKLTNTTIPPPPMAIFIQNLLEMQEKFIDPLKILTINYISVPSHPLNQWEMKFLEISKYIKRLLHIYTIVFKNKNGKSSSFSDLSDDDEYAILSNFLICIIRMNQNPKDDPLDHVVVPKSFSQKFDGKRLLVSKFSVIGKWNIYDYLMNFMLDSFNSSTIVWLRVAGKEIQITCYDPIIEKKLDNKTASITPLIGTAIGKGESNSKGQINPKFLIEQRIKELEIAKKKQKEGGERNRKEKLENKKNDQDEQASKKKMKKIQAKKLLKIKKEKEKESNKKENEKPSQLKEQPKKSQLQTLTIPTFIPKANSPKIETLNLESYKPEKRKPREKIMKKPEPTSRQRIHEQVNQGRLKKKKKMGGKSGGKSISTNRKSVKEKEGNESFKSSESSRGIKLSKSESFVKPLSKQAEPTINTGKPGKFGAKHVPLWKNETSDSNSTDEQEEISLVEPREKYPEMSKDEQDNEAFLMEALINLSIESDEPIVAESCSSSSSTLSSSSSSSLSKKVEFHQKTMKRIKRNSKQNRKALNKFLGNKSAFKNVQPRKKDISKDYENESSKSNSKAIKMDDEEHLNFLCDVASQSKNQK